MWTSCERSSFRGIETTINGNGGGGSGGIVGGPGSSQQETLADIEHISTIAGSFVSIVSISQTQPHYGTNDAGYDTEHTSLNSDFDEAELRRELLRDKWKLLFDMFDPEGFGEIIVDEFINALKSPEFISQVPMNKRELLLERAKKAKLPIGPGYITFQDFVNVETNLMNGYMDYNVHLQALVGTKKTRKISLETVTQEKQNKLYMDPGIQMIY